MNVFQMPINDPEEKAILREMKRIADEMREQTTKISDISRDYAVLVETVNNHMEDDKQSFKRLEGTIGTMQIDLSKTKETNLVIKTWGSVGLLIFSLLTSFTAILAIWAAFFKGITMPGQ